MQNVSERGSSEQYIGLLSGCALIGGPARRLLGRSFPIGLRVNKRPPPPPRASLHLISAATLAYPPSL